MILMKISTSTMNKETNIDIRILLSHLTVSFRSQRANNFEGVGLEMHPTDLTNMLAGMAHPDSLFLPSSLPSSLPPSLSLSVRPWRWGGPETIRYKQ